MAMLTATLAASLLAGSAIASPAYVFEKRAMRPYTAEMPIHESCNATEREALTQALQDVNTLAQWGKDYVVTNGAQDPLYLKWFGQGDYSSVVGVLDSLMSANKINMTLRCDNIDGNCGQEGWAGHWRGSNATSETVICPLSYEIREPLTEMCRNGHTIANASASYFFGTDLIHRMYHLPGLSDSEVSHYADSYNDCLELAQTNSSWAPFNTHTLQYFVAEAYANEVAAPGVGCTGEAPADEDHDDHSHASTTPTATASAAQSCHTHSDGEVHCV